MCGIIGAFNAEGLSKINLKDELKLMQHRGPDSEGTYYDKNIALGHRRLSIIDLSSSADQPMKDNNLIIVFNGEIYNYKEVKEELKNKDHKFKTSGDTEVILKSYIEWKESCVDHLEGMWAFCIYDSKNNTIFLSRDRIGEKPLVYYHDKKTSTFYFASEAPPLLSLAKLKPDIDYESLHHYFIDNYRHIPADRTIYKNIKKLQPANNLISKDNNITITRYWDISFKKGKNKDWIKEYNTILKKAVESREVADVPIGVLLSGGVDSSSIALYLNKDLITYSIGFSENDPELARAAKVSKILGIKNKQIIFSKDTVVNRALDINRQLIKNLGEPINLIQSVYTKLIMEEVKKDKIKVIIGGNGADELFYGYDTASKLRSLSILLKIFDNIPLNSILKKITLKLIKSLKSKTSLALRILALDNNTRKAEIYRYNGMKAKILYNNKMKKLIKDLDNGEIIKRYSKYCNSPNFIEKSYYTGLTVEDEHSITIVADVGAMADSIELRTPFLHRDLMEFSGILPIKHKAGSFFSKKHNKSIMKKALLDTPIKEIAYYKKMGFGFGIDMGECFRNEWKKETERLLFKILPKMDIFNIDYIKVEFNKVMKNKGNPNLLWRLISLAMWYELTF